MIAPPRFVESILSTLGASPEYRDLVIGDLNEEMELRARYDGADTARRWYVREALRSMPHLLGNGLRDGGFRGIARLLGLVLTAWTFVAMTFGVAFGIVLSLAARFFPEFRSIFFGGPGWAPLVIVAASSQAFLGGRIAAALSKRAPLMQAAALGVTWAALELVLIAIGRVGQVGLWFPVVVPPLMLGAAVAGGLYHLRKRARSEVSIDTVTF